MRTLIIGCGYVGLPLGAELVRQGHEVLGIRRTGEADHELIDAGITPLQADITRPGDLNALPGDFDWVVNLVSSSRGGADVYRRVYLEGARKILDRLSAAPPKAYVHTSSTSVYGQRDGQPVTETDATEPATETGRILVETEQELLAAAGRGFPALILRVAGIYGPGRGHLFLKYLADEARITGEGRRFINMIHLDDLVTSIIAALERGRPGEIYNIADDLPVTQLEFFEWLSRQLDKPMPPFAGPEEEAGRKRGVTHKQVSNRKLREELGVKLKFPTFRAGYGAEIQRMTAEGRISTES